MNFNIDRIAQLAGLSAGREGAGTLNESTGRRARPATTYDRVVEELQVRGLEMFYTPEQINEAIRSERRILAEEYSMQSEGACPKCGKKSCVCESTYEGMGFEGEDYNIDEAEHLLSKESDEMMHTDEALDDLEVGTTVKTPKGGEFKVTKKGTGGAAALAESKLRRIIDSEVARVLAEMSNDDEANWMYPDRKRPAGRTGGATMGFAGIGFKR
jgi:hypothetical protein